MQQIFKPQIRSNLKMKRVTTLKLTWAKILRCSRFVQKTKDDALIILALGWRTQDKKSHDSCGKEIEQCLDEKVQVVSQSVS